MIFLPYVLLIITISETGVIITPRVASSAAQCQEMLEARKPAASDRVFMQCVPHNASLELETINRPTS